jgi:GAF domain-containing protein
LSEHPTIKELHEFTGHPGEFWPKFCAYTCEEAGANHCILFRKQETSWKPRYHWPPGQSQQPPSESVLNQLAGLAENALHEGAATTQLAPPVETTVFALRLEEQETAQPSVAVLFVNAVTDVNHEEVLQRLKLLADAPSIYQRTRATRQTETDLACFADVLDLMLLINAEKRYLAAAMTLVNETAARYKCTRVSLGWGIDGYIKLQAISHMERFEQKMDVVTSLEAAMEEAFDQDEEILVPPNAESDAITSDHGNYARSQQIGSLLSLPLRIADRPVGILTCEREDKSFTDDDVHGLRILCDQVACRLDEFKQRERWFGARIKDAMRDRVAKLLGVDHTLTKLAGLAIFTLLLLAIIIKLPYRVEAPFILRSEDVRQISAPFESYIENVHVKIGQQVAENDLLLTLDTSDLLLEESAAIANQIRYLSEVEKARAFGTLIDMKIAQAQADQAQAQINLVQHRLAQSQLRVPIAGIIVEGDLEQLRGAPVSKGDILFKIARHEKLFVEIKIDEEDIHEITRGQTGELAFVSRPHLKAPFSIDQIDPVALSEDAGNVFIARGKDLQQVESWWRPGMSGIAKVDVGKRNILWIATHRTIDFFQMLMWW